MAVIAAVDGSACPAAIRTPSARSALPHLDDEDVWILFDDALDVAPGDVEGNVHTLHGREVRFVDHRPESIRRRPRKVSKTNPTGAIPLDARDPAVVGALAAQRGVTAAHALAMLRQIRGLRRTPQTSKLDAPTRDLILSALPRKETAAAPGITPLYASQFRKGLRDAAGAEDIATLTPLKARCGG